MTVTGNGSSSLVAVSDARTPAPLSAAGLVSSSQQGTAPIGVIIPPPDLRAIVDKTAQFIAKNGEHFEKRILSNEKDNSKFKFLSDKDPYNAYYRSKIEEIRTPPARELPSDEKNASGSGERKEAAQVPRAKGAAAPTVVLKQDDQVKKSVVVDQVLETPASEEYTVRVPGGLTALDLDVIRLTAQFVARNGKQFLTGLSSREHNNPQFHFLKPTHSMFTFFTELADAYSKVLMPTKKTLKNLEHDRERPAEVLARCLRRLEWMRVQEEEKRAREDKEEAERTAMALIDWNDFVVVETIDFFEEEEQQLPEPLSTKELVAMSKVEQVAAEEEDAAMEVEMDEDEMELVAEAGLASQHVQSAPDAPAPEPEMKIVKNYKRLSQVDKSKEERGTKFVVSPITGELVPVDEMAEHMRISLIDPKWREQRDAMLAKIKDTTKATDDEIARNVSSLANTRPDIFGSTEEEISKIVAAEIARSQKAASFMDQASQQQQQQQQQATAPPPPSMLSRVPPRVPPQMPPGPSGNPNRQAPMAPRGGGAGRPPPMYPPSMQRMPFRPPMQMQGGGMPMMGMPMPLPPGMPPGMPRGMPPRAGQLRGGQLRAGQLRARQLREVHHPPYPHAARPNRKI